MLAQPVPRRAPVDGVALALAASISSIPSIFPPNAIAGPSTLPAAAAAAPSPAPASPTRPARPPSRTERRFACGIEGCGKAYFKPVRLREHELTHTGECAQTYLRAAHLAAHLRTHRDPAERAHPCPRPGCAKRFWTATHLARHVDVHDRAEVHACPTCAASFPKSHLLREHVAAAHMPEGSRAYPCAACARSFATRQKLRAHEKTHDPTRYTCTHPSHAESPHFPTWSALQAHLHMAHPPACPFAECDGRTFKSSQRLKEHLRAHAEREQDLRTPRPNGERELPPVLAEMGRRRRASTATAPATPGRVKRARIESGSSDDDARNDGDYVPPDDKDDDGGRGNESSDDDASPSSRSCTTTPLSPATPRLARLAHGQAGKTHACHCGKAYKTRFARDEHARAAHEGVKHVCALCGRGYKRRVSLRRHTCRRHHAAGEAHTGNGVADDEGAAEREGEGEGRRDGEASGSGARPAGGPDRRPSHSRGLAGIDVLTGSAASAGGALFRRWACPAAALSTPGVALGVLGLTPVSPQVAPIDWGLATSSCVGATGDPAGLGCSIAGANADVDASAAAVDAARLPAELARAAPPATAAPPPDAPCAERFHRVYDVRRHLAARHGVVLDDLGVRMVLLRDGQTGE